MKYKIYKSTQLGIELVSQTDLSKPKSFEDKFKTFWPGRWKYISVNDTGFLKKVGNNSNLHYIII